MNLAPGTTTLDGGAVSLTTNIVPATGQAEWLTFTYATTDGRALSQAGQNFTLNQAGLQPAVPLNLIGTYFQFNHNGAPLTPTRSPFGGSVTSDPVPGESGTGISGTQMTPLTGSAYGPLGNFINPFGQLSGDGIDPTMVTGEEIALEFAPQSTTPINPATIPIFRFFDTIYGTHLFTQSQAEALQILATRPDLTQETNNFGSVNSTAPAAEPIYRFFETGNGTHFFTLNQTEFAGLTTPGSRTYRRDFTYEASSTFYEDSTQQAGDVAVYRLFDSVHGTQFLTGSQTEYAGLTTPGSGTYRSDLGSEGIAFYAPAGTFHT